MLFGVFGVVFTVAAFGLAWLFWWPVLSAFGGGLWSSGLVGQILLVLLTALMLSPLLHGLGGMSLAHTRRWVSGRVQTLRFRAQRGWRIEAGEMIAALPHAANLTVEELNDVAGRVDRRLFHAGQVLVRQGDAADTFYLIRSGQCAVLERTTDGAEAVVATCDSGATFGELALLEGTPRSATVRAETAGEVFAIDAATFQLVLAGVFVGDHPSPPGWPLIQVWQLSPLRHLDLGAVTELVAGGTWVHAAPGDEIIRFGAAGDGFYVVGSGQLQATRDAAVLGSRSPGLLR